MGMVIDEPEDYGILTIQGHPVLTPSGARHFEALERLTGDLLAALREVDTQAMQAGGGTGWGPLARIHAIASAAITGAKL